MGNCRNSSSSSSSSSSESEADNELTAAKATEVFRIDRHLKVESEPELERKFEPELSLEIELKIVYNI